MDGTRGGAQHRTLMNSNLQPLTCIIRHQVTTLRVVLLKFCIQSMTLCALGCVVHGNVAHSLSSLHAILSARACYSSLMCWQGFSPSISLILQALSLPMPCMMAPLSQQEPMRSARAMRLLGCVHVHPSRRQLRHCLHEAASLRVAGADVPTSCHLRGPRPLDTGRWGGRGGERGRVERE